MNGAVARIILRYVAGGLVLGSPVVGERLAQDPDLVMLVGALVGIATEGFYYLAKRRGWKL